MGRQLCKVATIFISNAYGLELTFVDFINVILTSTLASIGTAGVGIVGIIMLRISFKLACHWKELPNVGVDDFLIT